MAEKPNIPEIERQLDGITPGFWRNYKTTVESYTITPDLPFPQEDEFIARIPDSDVDGAFIASAPSTIRSLIAYIKELEAERDKQKMEIGQAYGDADEYENKLGVMIGKFGGLQTVDSSDNFEVTFQHIHPAHFLPSVEWEVLSKSDLLTNGKEQDNL